MAYFLRHFQHFASGDNTGMEGTGSVLSGKPAAGEKTASVRSFRLRGSFCNI